MAQLFELTPAQTLRFESGKLEERLVIRNTTQKNIAYKVKTTAPKSYVVRPSNDVLKSGEQATVKIVLQPGQDAPGRESSHRFLVQALAIDGLENLTKEQWTRADKAEIHEVKMNVSYDTDSSAAPASATRGAPGGGTSIQAKYDELVKYTVTLEEQTLLLQREKETLEAKVGQSDFRFSLWHIVLAVVIAIALSKLPAYM
ncbi:unnamed protein product [Amoebophrya sp. A25]|nr:unnamed protein product [Amoebophrya sp. A25]|eukprot:GSA25T00004691001.1